MHNRSLVQRLALGVTGQATFRAVTALGSLLVIPALIRGWGVRGYGEWIALTALTSYMGYSNFGVVSTSMNEMIMACGAGDQARARRVFQMSINLALYVIAPVIGLIALLLIVSPAIDVMKFATIDRAAASWITVLVACQVWFLTLRGILIAVLYARGSYGFVYYMVSGAKLMEFAIIAVGAAMFGLKPLEAASVMAAIALLEVAIIAVFARRAASWMTVDLRIFDGKWIAAQAQPSAGFVLGNFAAQGILLQGARIVLGALLGGGAVAVYAIYGTAMRLVDQLLQIMVLPLEVEMAHSLGRNEPGQTGRLVVIGTQMSWLMFLGVGAFLMLFGPLVFHWWTDGRIPFSRGLMALYLGMSMASLLGRVSTHALISTNRMYGPSFAMLVCAALALTLGGVLTPLLKTPGMVIGGIAGELATSLIALHAVARLLDRPLRGLLGDMLDFGKSYGEIRRRAWRLMERWKAA